jgi:hypothetical protein
VPCQRKIVAGSSAISGPPTHAQLFLKILEQADVIKNGGTLAQIHQQVNIAARASFFPGDRAEHGNPMSPAPARDTENLRAAPPRPARRPLRRPTCSGGPG